MKIFLNAYIANNFGDDLFLNILLNRYPNHEFYAISQFSNNYNYNYKNLHIFSSKFFYRLIRKLDLKKYIANHFDMVLTIGGSMFIENSSKILSVNNKKHYILNINFGPYQSKEYFDLALKSFSKCEDICFREKYSYDLFQKLSNVRWASDVAFGLDTSKLNITNRKKAVISVISCEYKFNENLSEKSNVSYTEKYEKLIVDIIEKLIQEKNYEVVLASLCEEQGDSKAVDDIIGKCSIKSQEKIMKYIYRGNLEEALNIFADSSLIIGSRLHSNIVGLVLGKQVIPIAYSDKTIHVIEDLFLEYNDNNKLNLLDIRNLNNIDIEEIFNNYILKYDDVSKLKQQGIEQFRELDKKLL